MMDRPSWNKPHIYYTPWKCWEVAYKGFVIIAAKDIATIRCRWPKLLNWIDFYEGRYV